MPLLVVTGSLAVATVLAAIGGVGAMVVEVLADTGLQRCLDEDVLARAYGFAYPAAIGGIAVGSLIAAPLVAVFGAHGTLLALGAAAAVPALVMLRRAPERVGAALTASPEPVAATS